MEVKVKGADISKYLMGLAVVAFFILSLSLRLMPLEKLDNYLQAIDPYYIFRTTQDLVNNGFVLKDLDTMRFYPTGFSPKAELYYLYYIYGVLYVLFFKWSGVSFLKFAQIIPAVLGASYVILAYFIGKELKDRYLGFFSSVAVALMTIIYHRSSAGFFEKEPLSGFFALLSFLFFVKSYKRPNTSNILLFALFTALSYAVWGGAISLYYLYSVILIGLWVTNNLNWDQAKILAAGSILASFFYVFMYSKYSLLKSGALALLWLSGLFIFAVEFYFRSRKLQRKPYTNSLILGSVLFVLFIGSFFSSTLARNIEGIYGLVIYKKAVMESTVAENVPANWGYFKASYLANTSQLHEFFSQKISALNAAGLSFLGYLLYLIEFIAGLIFTLFSPLVMMLLGIAYILYISSLNEKKITFKVAIVVSYFILLLSYYFFILSQGTLTSANVVYALIAAVIILYTIAKRPLEGTLLVFVLASFLMFVTKVRIGFLAGLWSSFVVAYGMYSIFHIFTSYFPGWFKEKDYSLLLALINHILAGFIVLLYVISNYFVIYDLASSTTLGNLNPAWFEAFDFMKNDLPANATILSWWDFGYWFQTLGNKTTLLDGGNQLGYRNVFAARYFTSRYNESEEMLYLAVAKPTHILLDFSMIGKYAAMSKIANNGKWIDHYAQFGFYTQKFDQLIYRSGPYSVYVPITKNGTFDFSRTIDLGITSAGYSNLIPLRYLCTREGVIDTFELANHTYENYVDECFYIVPVDYRIGFMTFKMPNVPVKREIYNSNFHKLYIEDGQRIPYVKKVFDNYVIKIYEVDYDYVYDKLKEYNITQSYINYTFEKCILTKRGYKDLLECPLYYYPWER